MYYHNNQITLSERLLKLLRIVCALAFVTLSAQLYAASESTGPFKPEDTENTDNPEPGEGEEEEDDDDDDDDDTLVLAGQNQASVQSGNVAFFENGAGLLTNPDTSNVTGYVGVINGELTPMVNESNWPTLQEAIDKGFTRVAEDMRNSVVLHEQGHLDSALSRNPTLDGSQNPDLPEGSALGFSKSINSAEEWTQHQRQLDYLAELYVERKYSDGMSDEELSLYEKAMDDIAKAQNKYAPPTPPAP